MRWETYTNIFGMPVTNYFIYPLPFLKHLIELRDLLEPL